MERVGLEFTDIADELYGLDPADFVAARTTRVRDARAAGDKALAAAVGKLRKPTVVGWVVNLLARDAPGEVEALLALGDALRDAQRHLSGTQLRDLSRQRQQVVQALARKAGKLAAEHGKPVGEDVIRDVGQTLNAALADADTAELVRSGRVVTAANYEGFGPAGLAVVGGGPTERAAPVKKEEASGLLAAARQEREQAAAAVADAEQAFEAAGTDAEDAATRLSDVDDRIAELQEELERAHHERTFAKNAEKAAAEAAKAAEKDLDKAKRRLSKVESMIEALEDDD